MKENPRKVSKSAIKSENALNEKEDFIMLPTVDFCFKELMQNENVRKGIIAAILNRRPDEIVNTELLPTILRKDSYVWNSSVRVQLDNEVQIDFEMHILELPKLPPEQKSETDLMQWMRFLNGKRREDFEKMAKKNSCFEEAYKELDKLSADEKKRLEYEARQKAIRDRDILIKTGENRGRKEIILSMIEAGLPLEQIAEITKETLETIQELKKKMG